MTKPIDAAFGTGGDTTEAERFTIDSAERADWLLKKLLHLDAEKATVEAMAAQRIEELEADKNRLLARFGGELEAWARTEAEKRHRQTITLMYGAVSFRKVPARLTLSDELEAINAARSGVFLFDEGAPAPSFFSTVESFDKAAYLAHARTTLEATGELLPGIETTEERTSFAIKFGTSAKKKGGDTPTE